MLSFAKVLRKSKAIIRKGPSTLRIVFYSKLGYWPVDRIDGCELQAIPTYCISLVRAQARRRMMATQAERMGLSQFRIVDAVDSRNLDYESLERDGRYNESACRAHHPDGISLNHIACSLSHAALYDLIARSGDPISLIVEDDALFVTRRMMRFRLADVPADFDVIFLNAFLDQTPPRGHIQGMVYDDSSFAGSTAAYLISAKGAQKLRDASLPVIHGADGLLGRSMIPRPGEDHPFKQKGAFTQITSYILYPELAINGSTRHYHVTEVGKETS
jgi:GR25 family glycosyltransferase involved in LPS biosynthesis